MSFSPLLDAIFSDISYMEMLITTVIKYVDSELLMLQQVPNYAQNIEYACQTESFDFWTLLDVLLRKYQIWLFTYA